MLPTCDRGSCGSETGWRGGVVGYVLRRLVQMGPMLLGASLLIFLVVRMAPGDPLAAMVDPRMDPQKMEEMRARLCLDCPVLVQYWGWLKEVLRGDLGTSIRFQVPVAELIGARLGPTILLGMAAFGVTYLVGIPLGVLTAVRRHSWLELTVTVLSFAALSMPAFFFGLLLLKLFALGGLRILPSSGMITPGAPYRGAAAMLDVASHLVLPALALGLSGVAGLVRYVRASMVEVLRQDYVRTARAKGLAEKQVIYRHALRNGLIPVVTLVGLTLPDIVGGAILTESIFVWPGVGRLTYTALLERDYPVLMALNLLFAGMVMLGSLAADVGYALVDPRVRYE